MAKSKNLDRPEKKTTTELLRAIEDALDHCSYYFSAHATKRSKERKNVSEIQ